MPPVTSSAIERIDYDDRAQELRIAFVGGNVYKYYGVPRPIYDRFLRARSKGAFFNLAIKDRFDFAQQRAA
jgi:KTSC domain-containing protein